MKLFANLSQKLLPATFMTIKKAHPHQRQADARRDTSPLPHQYQRAMANTQPASTQPQSLTRARPGFPASVEPLQHVQRALTGSHVANSQTQDVEADSLRSRASSVVSTGTRFSISTLPVEEPSQIDGLLGRLNHASAFRPRSIMSTTSYEQPAPPYESRSAGEAPILSNTQHDLTFLGLSPVVPGDSQQSPTISSEEDSLTMHYSRVVRTIDQNHNSQMRRLKEAHQEELGATRNAIDQTYRKELKGKAREVEKVREEMASLAATHEADLARLQREALEQATDQAESHRTAMEKACNSIEDLWEARWNDRMRLVAEEARKANADFKSRCDAALADRNQALEREREAIRRRDQAWIEELSKRHPSLSDEFHAILGALNHSPKSSNEDDS